VGTFVLIGFGEAAESVQLAEVDEEEECSDAHIQAGEDF
jgi:hypothetical protein